MPLGDRQVKLQKPEEIDVQSMGEIYFALCKAVDSPVSLGCWLRYKYGEWVELASKKVSPSDYTSLPRFRDDYLVVSYLSKWKGLPTGIDREAVAIEGFAASEIQCRKTNERLRNAQRGDFNPRVEPILLLAQLKIAHILEGVTYSDALGRCGWGKGATATLKGAEATLVRKIDPGKGRISVTRRAAQYLLLQLNSDPAWMSQLARAEVLGPYSAVPRLCLEIVEGNRVTTVPKDATKDRTIAAEPTGNIFLQLGVGKAMRKALRKRCGIDLDDQSRNQYYAYVGSLTDEYATVDLRSASDTISTELVKQLLPLQWSGLLDSLRSPKGKVGSGEWFVYEKFSSMGNGFTFELETLLFYAIAASVVQHLGLTGRVLVYGDDIILPGRAYPLLTETLVYCGFEVNPNKSYGQGPFRESCGKHYWLGVDVTPVYQKETFWEKRDGENRLVLPEGYRCANRILRLAARRGHLRWFDDTLHPMWRGSLRVFGFDRHVRHVVPWDAEGDDGLALPWEDLLDHVSSVKHGLVKLPVLSFKPAKIWVSPDEQGAILAYWLRQSASGSTIALCSAPSKEDAIWPWCGETRRSDLIRSVVDLLADDSQPFAGKLVVRRRGNYVSRRRMYPIGTLNVAWM